MKLLKLSLSHYIHHHRMTPSFALASFYLVWTKVDVTLIFLKTKPVPNRTFTSGDCSKTLVWYHKYRLLLVAWWICVTAQVSLKSSKLDLREQFWTKHTYLYSLSRSSLFWASWICFTAISGPFSWTSPLFFLKKQWFVEYGTFFVLIWNTINHEFILISCWFFHLMNCFPL